MSAAQVREQLFASGYLRYVSEHTEAGHGWYGRMDLAVLPALRADDRFASGVFWGMHQDVGSHLCDYRSFNGKFGPGSLQLVIDRETGHFWADIDRHNPYEDLVRFFGHAFTEVLPGFFRRKKKTDQDEAAGGARGD